MTFSNGQNGEGNPIRGRGEYDVTSDPLNKMNGKTNNTQLFGDFLIEAMKTQQDPAGISAQHSNMFDRQPPSGGNYGNNPQQQHGGNFLNNVQQHGSYGNQQQQQHGSHFGGHGNHNAQHNGGLNMGNSAGGNVNASSHMNNGHFPLDAQSQFSAQAQLIEALAMQSLQVRKLSYRQIQILVIQ